MCAEKPTILLIEDDPKLAFAISEYLTQNGFDLLHEPRGDTGARRIVTDHPDLVILDLMLPGMDGIEVCRTVRQKYAGPVMMLTARDENIEQMVGLEVGIDDHITKPVLPRVLLARIRVLLRRVIVATQNNLLEEALVFDNPEIQPGSRAVFVDGDVIEFTTTEFDLLPLLASHAGAVLSRDEIYQALSGIEYDGLDCTVDIKISRLRKLIKDSPDHPQRIQTVRGKGYLFAKGGNQ